LFHALLQAAEASGAVLVAGAEVTAIEAPGITVNGKVEGPFDLIVNASGARSALSPVKTRALPYGAIWGTVPWPDTALPRDQLQQRYRRADRMIGVLPVGQLPDSEVRIATIFWSLPRDSYDDWSAAPLEHWKREATELWPEMRPFLEAITDHDQMTMARYAHGALLAPVRGRVVHLGDAAHQTSPQLGQGANMALLDAQALDRALRDPDLDMALHNYRKGRLAHVWLYQLLSAAFTPQYQSDSRVLPALRDRVLYPLSQIWPVPKILTRLVCGSLLPPTGSLPK
jgi:2-polyprenyl-6-methoxyphenol hydroxylase-like FAD-dependent oxidoreductase